MRNGLSEQQGINVVVENNTKQPAVVTGATLIYPGAATMIGLTTTVYSRLEHPFESNCTAKFPPEYSLPHRLCDSCAYSGPICGANCFNTMLMMKCKCFNTNFIEGFVGPFGDMDMGKVNFCSKSPMSEEKKCFDMMCNMAEKRTDNPCPLCKSECTETVYTVRTLVHRFIVVFNILKYDQLRVYNNNYTVIIQQIILYIYEFLWT